MDNSEQDTAVCLDLYIETLEEAAKKNDHFSAAQSSSRDHSNSSCSSLDIYSDLDDDYHNTLWDEAPNPCEDQDVKSKLSLQEFNQIQAELQHWKMAYKDLESKFCALNKNMFSLCLTARREVACKDAEIAQLKKSHIAASTKSKVSIDQAVQTDLLAVAENNVQKMRYALPCLTEDCTVLSTRHKDTCESFAVFTDKAEDCTVLSTRHKDTCESFAVFTDKAEDCTVLSTSHIDASESFADKATSLITDIKTSYNSRSFSPENSSVRKSTSSPDSTLHTNSHLNTSTMKRITTLGSGNNICSASVSDIIPTASSSSVSPSLSTDTDLCSVLNCHDGASNLSIPSNFANSIDKINSTNSLTGTVLPSIDISIPDVACAKTCTGTVSTLHTKMHQFTLPQSDVVSKDGSIYNKTEDFMVMVSDILLPAQHQNNDTFNIDTEESAAQDFKVVSVVQALGNAARPLQENNSAEVTVPVIHPLNAVTHKVSSAETAILLTNPLKAVTHKVINDEATIPIAHPLNYVTNKVSSAETAVLLTNPLKAVTHKVINDEATIPIAHPLNYVTNKVSSAETAVLLTNPLKAVTHKVSNDEATIPIAHPLNYVTNKVSSAETAVLLTNPLKAVTHKVSNDEATIPIAHPLNYVTNKVSSAETTLSVTHPLNPLTHKVSSTEATVPAMQHVENITFDRQDAGDSVNDMLIDSVRNKQSTVQKDAGDSVNDMLVVRAVDGFRNKQSTVQKDAEDSLSDMLMDSVKNKQSVQKDAEDSLSDMLIDSVKNKQSVQKDAEDSLSDMLIDSVKNKQSVQKDAEDSLSDMLIDSVKNKQSVQKDAEDSVNDTLKISAMCIKNKQPEVQESAEDMVNDITPIGGLLRSSLSGSLNNITPCESGIVECIEIINAKEQREFERDFDHVDVKHEADAEMECAKHVPDKYGVSLKYLCNSRSCKHKKSQESRYKKVNRLRLSKISFVKKKNKDKLKIKSTIPFILKQTNWLKSRKACNLKKLLAKRKLDEGIKRNGLHLPSKDSNGGFNKENLFVPKEGCKLVYNAVDLFVPGHDSVENLYIPNEDRKRVPSKEKLFVPDNDCKRVPYEKALFIPSDDSKHPNKVLPALPALRDDRRCAHGVLPCDDSKETLNEFLGVPNVNSKVALHMLCEKNSQVPNEGDKLVPSDEHKDGCHKADDVFLSNGKFQNCSHTTNESTKFKESLFAPSKDKKFEKDTHTVNKRTNVHQKLKQSNRMPKHSSFKNTRGKQDILNGRNSELMRNGKRKMKSKTNAAYICEQKEVRSNELASEYKKRESNTKCEEIYLVHNSHLLNYTPNKKYKYINDSSIKKMSAELYICETVKEKTDKLTNYKKGNSAVGIPEISISQSLCEQTDLQEPRGDITTIDKMLEKCITSTDDSDISIYTDESDGEQLMTAVHFRDRATYISLPVESSVLQPSCLDCDDSVDICDIVSSQLSNLAEPVKENTHYLSENVTCALPMIPFTKNNCSDVCAISPVSFSDGQWSSPDCHFLGNSQLKVFSESSSLARSVTLQADLQVSRSSEEDSDKIDIEKTFCGKNQDSLIINMTHNCLVNDQDHNATSDANISSNFFKCANLSPVLSDATFSSKSDLELKCQNSCTSNTTVQDESRKLEPISSLLWSPEKSMMSYSRQQPMSSRSFDTFLGISSSNTMLDDSITQASFFTISLSTEKNRQENDDCVKDSLIDSDNVQVHGKIETVEQDKNQTDNEAIISHRNVSTFGFNSPLSSEGQPISNFCVKQLSAKQDDKITPANFSLSSTYSDQEKINTAPFSFLSSALNSSTFSSHCSSDCDNSSVLRETKDNMPPIVICARDEAIESSSGFPHSFDAKQTFSLSTDLKRHPERCFSFSRTNNLSGKQQQRFGTHDSEKLMLENIVQDLSKIDAETKCETHIPFNCVKTVIQNICHESVKLDRQIVSTNGIGGSSSLSSNPLYNTTLGTAKRDLEDGELESIENGHSCGRFSVLGVPTHTFYSGSLEEGEVLSSDGISDPYKSDVRFVSHTFGLMDSDNAKFLDIHDILKCQRPLSSQDNGNSFAPGKCNRNEKLSEATGKALINTIENSSESKQIGNTENDNYMIYKNCQPNLSQDPCKQIVNNPCREADVNSSRQLVINPSKASDINQDMGSGRSTRLNQSSQRKYPQPSKLSSHEKNVLPNLSLVQSENREIEKHISMESNESGFAAEDWLSIQNVKLLHPLEKNKSLFSLAPKEPEVMCSSLSGTFPTCSSIHTYKMVSHRNSSENYMSYQNPKKTHSLEDEFSETVSEHIVQNKTVGCQGFLAATVSQLEEELIVDDLKVHECYGNSLIEELPGCARTRVFKSLNHPNTFIKDELVHVEEVASGKDGGEQEICENMCDVSDQENCSFEDFLYLGNQFRTDSNKNKSVKERPEEKSCDKSKEDADVKCSNDTLDKKISYCGRNASSGNGRNSSAIDDFNQESLLDENNKPDRLNFSISNNDHLYEENLITNSDGKFFKKGHTSHQSFPLNDKAPGQNQTMTNRDDEFIEYMNNSKDSSRLVNEKCGKKKSESLKILKSSVTHLEDDFQTSFDHQNLICVKQESGYVTSSLPCSNTRQRSLFVDHLSLGTSAESLTLLEELNESSRHESLVVSSDSRKEIQKKEQTNQEKRKCFMYKNVEYNNNSDSEKMHSSIENIRCVAEKSSLTNGQVKDSLQHNEERTFCVKSIQDPVDKGVCKSVLPEYTRKRESSNSRKSKGGSKSLLPEYTRRRESSCIRNSKGGDKSLLPEYTRRRESSYRRKSKRGCKSLLPEYTRKRESTYTKNRDCLQHVKSRDSYKHHDRNDTLEFPHMSDCHVASRMVSAPCSCSIMTTCKCSQTFHGSSSCLKQKSNHHSERYSECNKLNHSSVDNNFNRDYQKSCSSKNCNKSHLLNRSCYDYSRTRPDMVDAKQCDLKLDQRSLPKKHRLSIFSESGGYKQHRRDQTSLKTENDMKKTSDESQLGIYTTHSCHKVNKCQHDCSLKDSYFNFSECSKHGHHVRHPCNDCCKKVSKSLMECQVDLNISKTKKDNDRRQCHLDKQEIERQKSENPKLGSSRSRSPRSRSSRSRSSRSRSPRSRSPLSRSSSRSKGIHKR